MKSSTFKFFWGMEIILITELKESVPDMKSLVDTMTAISVPQDILNCARIGKVWAFFLFGLKWKDFTSEVCLCFRNFDVRHRQIHSHCFSVQICCISCSFIVLSMQYFLCYVVPYKDTVILWQTFLCDIIYSGLIFCMASVTHEPDQLC